MSGLNLTKLREIAEVATDGPWNLHTLRTDETHDIRGSIDDEANIVIYAECEDADADHIATFDPPTALALIDEIERVRADEREKIARAIEALEYSRPEAATAIADGVEVSWINGHDEAIFTAAQIARSGGESA